MVIINVENSFRCLIFCGNHYFVFHDSLKNTMFNEQHLSIYQIEILHNFVVDFVVKSYLKLLNDSALWLPKN